MISTLRKLTVIVVHTNILIKSDLSQITCTVSLNAIDKARTGNNELAVQETLQGIGGNGNIVVECGIKCIISRDKNFSVENRKLYRDMYLDTNGFW